MRYFRLFSTLRISGFTNLLIDLPSGVLVKISGAMKFFPTLMLGVMSEDALIKAYGALSSQRRGSYLPKNVWRLIWVMAFLTSGP